MTPFAAGRPVEALAAAATGVAQILATRVQEDCPVQIEPGGVSRYDRFIDGLNRLPRPCLTIGTFGFFAYAMADPEGFSDRMRGLAAVPDPLWWLLGAVVSFHFGAREAHHHRVRRGGAPGSRGSAPDPGVFRQNEGESEGEGGIGAAS